VLVAFNIVASVAASLPVFRLRSKRGAYVAGLALGGGFGAGCDLAS